MEGQEPESEGYIGNVREIVQNTKGNYLEVDFFLDVLSADGSTVLDTIPIEMTGHNFQGIIREQDMVRILGKWDPESGASYRIYRLYNFSAKVYYHSSFDLPNSDDVQDHYYLSKKRNELKAFLGEVRNLFKEYDGDKEIWRFELYAIDYDDNLGTFCRIEMKGKEIDGNLLEGDRVLVLKDWKKHDKMKIDELFNLRTYRMVNKH